MNKPVIKNEIDQLIGEPVKNWKVCKSPPKTIMRGNYCIIDILNIEKHAEELFYSFSKDMKNFDTVESKGVMIYIEPTATMFLIGSEMDYATDKLSSRFIFNNPNEKSTCGCGESFNI